MAVVSVACVHSSLLDVIVPSRLKNIGVVSSGIWMEVIDTMGFCWLFLKA